MGGDQELWELVDIIAMIRQSYPDLKVCLYTGSDKPPPVLWVVLDYLKYGHYDPDLGGLKERTTNQRMYRIDEIPQDITWKFWRKPSNGFGGK